MSARVETVGSISVCGADGERGDLTVLRSSIGCRFDGEIDLLHVISAHAGGQVRGYKRGKGARGAWTVSTPAYEGNWVAVDLAVSSLLSEPIRGIDGIVRRTAA